jgi:tetratricopeptide (TPR) repeat protein
MNINKRTNRQTKIVLIGCLILVIILGGYLFSKKTFPHQISDLQKQASPMFDSLSKQMNDEDNFQGRITLLMEHRDLVLANQLIDSAIKSNPNNGLFHTYKGMAYTSENKYTEAIKQYDTSILLTRSEFPLVLSKKAEVFIKLKDYTNAITFYKRAALLNGDFNYNVAQTFEEINKKDSALKYYSLYQTQYPSDTLVSKKVASLSN